MTKIKNPKDHLLKLFDQKKCLTIEDISQSLDYSLISIRRFLKTIGYYSSFTDNSKWYTLLTIPSFNKKGLWFYQKIGFSMHGNLIQTILHFINTSPQGFTAKELTNIVSTPCSPVLNVMYKKKQIDRFKTIKGFVHISIKENIKELQLKRINALIPEKKIKRLNPQAAIFVLVEFIKHPISSFVELSKAVEKKQVKAPPEAIAQLFKDHDLKKTPL
jgi:hypothetical protein